MKTLKKLRPDHWAWLHAKAAMMVWAILFFIYTPISVTATLEVVLAILISVVVVIGVGFSVVGLLMSTSIYVVKSRQGLSIELAGLCFAISGPISYFVARFYLIFGPGGDQGIALVALSYAIASFMLVRIVIVYSHRKRVTE